MARELMDSLAAYIEATRPPFEQLRQAAAQLAGILVLGASGARDWTAHPMAALAIEAAEAARDGVRAVLVPPEARHHHRHLLQAGRAIAEAVGRLRDHTARRGTDTVDAVLASVKDAHRELQWATTALPGFEMVALSQACCAAHRA